MQNKSLIIGILLVISPILFCLVVYPDSFSLSWNQGRGGFLFAMAFIVAEIVGIKYVIPRKRFLYWNCKYTHTKTKNQVKFSTKRGNSCSTFLFVLSCLVNDDISDVRRTGHPSVQIKA